jgi:hypothetical protein
MVLARGARVGIVNLLDAGITHYHTARDLQSSFLKTQYVPWHIEMMLADALKERLAQLGLVLVPLAPTDALRHSRETCFLNSALAKGLPRDCAPPFAQLAGAEHVDAFIVLGPGLNDSVHGKRRRDLPDYLRGWGFVTGVPGAPGKPELFNMTELLLIGAGTGVRMGAREWGGSYQQQWSSFEGQPEQRVQPDDELNKLAPLFLDILTRQCSRLLEQVDVR